MYQLYLIALIITTGAKSQTSCKQNSPNAVCAHPKPIIPDFKWTQETQPADGWHMELGNSAVRLHIAEMIQGKLLNYTDDFSNMCGRSRLEHNTNGVDGKFYGFNGGKSTYNCYPSNSVEGAIYCDFSSVGLNKYGNFLITLTKDFKTQDDHSLTYISFTEHKNLIVAIYCFPNGENGWVTFSKTKSLTEEETKAVLDHIKSLGYDDTDVVPMYSESCTDNSVDASYLAIERVRPDRPRFRNIRLRGRYYYHSPTNH